jgi:hypothetical protein
MLSCVRTTIWKRVTLPPTATPTTLPVDTEEILSTVMIYAIQETRLPPRLESCMNNVDANGSAFFLYYIALTNYNLRVVIDCTTVVAGCFGSC